MLTICWSGMCLRMDSVMTTTIEAPYECASLFRIYLSQGRRGDIHADLVKRMRPFNGAWMISHDWVFRVVEYGGRETLEWERRSKVLEQRGERT
jgi:hypothetical protein